MSLRPKRLLLTLAALLAVGAASAQAPPPELQSAFTWLGDSETAYVVLSGWQVIGTQQVQIHDEAYFDESGKQPKAELTESLNGVITRRVVGDGQTMWAYDIAHRQYSAAAYSAAQKGDEIQRLLNLFMSRAEGASARIGLLLLQSFGPNGALFSSWEPQFTGFDTSNPVVDPISGDQISPPQFGRLVCYGTNVSGTDRSLVFIVVPDPINSGEWDLSDVIYSEARGKTLTKWRMHVTAGIVIPTKEFEPYSWDSISKWTPISPARDDSG